MRLKGRVSFLLTVSLFVSATHFAVAAASTPEQKLVDGVKNGPLQKLGPWLANLSDEFQQSPDKQNFTTQNPVIKVYGGKVAVDMYANDPAALQSSLASLGADNIQTTGALVSAQVPVSALTNLAGLSSLEFANAA